MGGVLCWLWPLLFGALLGWLGAGALALREMARRPAAVQHNAAPPSVNPPPAEPQTVALTPDDDLELIDGIGPKIAEVLRAAGVKRWLQLAQMAPEQIQSILNASGPRFRIAVPTTWPEQAALAARGDRPGLKSLQDTLRADKRKNKSE